MQPIDKAINDVESAIVEVMQSKPGDPMVAQIVGEVNNNAPVWSRVDGRLQRLGGSVKTSTGGRRKLRGGARCAPNSRQRQIVRLMLMIALAALGWTGGPIAVDKLSTALQSISALQCSVAAGGSGLKNVICGKYADFLFAVNGLIYNVSANSTLQQVGAFLGGITVAGTVSSVKNGLVALLTGGKDKFEQAVDQVCQLLFDEDGNLLPAAKPVADSDMTTGGRKSRRSKRTLKKKRVAKKSTRKLSFRY